MTKKYAIELSTKQRRKLTEITKNPDASDREVRRATILLKADTKGPALSDTKICKAINCRLRLVEQVRRRFSIDGFSSTVFGKKTPRSPLAGRRRLLTGENESKAKAIYFGPPPEGNSKWSSRLLAKKFVSDGLVKSIAHETVLQTLRRWR